MMNIPTTGRRRTWQLAASVLTVGAVLQGSQLPSFAALNAYLTIKGQKQGEIKGSVTQKGREGQMKVTAYSHSIVSPRDAASGQATGKRQHKPLAVTMPLDKATPQLYTALVNNESLPQVTLRFWRARPGAGGEEQFYTIQLTNASIASIDQRLLNTENPELARFAEYEEISFTYQKIAWTWSDGSITAEDDWESPVSWLQRGAPGLWKFLV